MSTRKSSRVVKSGKSNPPTAKDEAFVSDSEDKSEDEAPKKKTKTGVKRKAKSSSNKSAGPAPKRPRGNRGLLKDIVDMPLDIVFEIFKELSPRDLLSLAQTSKDLRNILMSKSSVSIWKAARANIPGLPDCPAGVSEPLYATLFFTKHCMSCLRPKMAESNTFNLWGARVRLCKGCAERDCTQSNGGFTYAQAQILPSITLSGRRGYQQTYYHKQTMEVWRKRLVAASDKEAKNRVELEMKAAFEHAAACEAWYQLVQEHLEDQRLAEIEARKNIVVEHAKKLGWAEELQLTSSAAETLKESDVIRKACSKNLTEKALNNLDEAIGEIMEGVRVKRLVKAQKELLHKRLPIFVQVVQQCRKTRSPSDPLPSPRQLYEIPFVRDLILNTPNDVDMTAVDFQPVADNFTMLMDEWSTRMKANLMEVVKTAQKQLDVVDVELFLNQASTVFICYKGSCPHRRSLEPLCYPRAVIHSCTRNTYGSNPRKHTQDISHLELEELQTLKELLKEERWNYYGNITYRPELTAMVGDILEFCGLKRNATKEEMDAADPILECLACHKGSHGRVVMKWWNTIQHWGDHHDQPEYGWQARNPKMKLRLVTDEVERDTLRKELAVHQERCEAVMTESSVCAQCHEEDTAANLKTHWKQIHQRKAVDGDILPNLDHAHYKEDYYAWPPRDDDEHAIITGTEFEPLKPDASKKI